MAVTVGSVCPTPPPAPCYLLSQIKRKRTEGQGLSQVHTASGRSSGASDSERSRELSPRRVPAGTCLSGGGLGWSCSHLCSPGARTQDRAQRLVLRRPLQTPALLPSARQDPGAYRDIFIVSDASFRFLIVFKTKEQRPRRHLEVLEPGACPQE